MRQKFRKYVKDMEEDMKKFRENPNVGEDEEEDEKGNYKIILNICVI